MQVGISQPITRKVKGVSMASKAVLIAIARPPPARTARGPSGDPVKGEQIEDQAVEPPSDDRRADRPGPQRFALRPDFQSREYIAVGEFADPEGDHRDGDNPRGIAEHWS